MCLRGVRLSTKAGRRCVTATARRRLRPKLLERSPRARPSNDPSRTPPLRESTGARPVRERRPKRGSRSTFRRVSPGPLTPVGGTTRSAPPAVAPRPHPAGVIDAVPGHGAPNHVPRRTHGPQRLAARRQRCHVVHRPHRPGLGDLRRLEAGPPGGPRTGDAPPMLAVPAPLPHRSGPHDAVLCPASSAKSFFGLRLRSGAVPAVAPILAQGA
jgi:hypothetical protein